MGRRPVVSQELAARAALALVDDQGLDALSLEAVAGRLGVTAPSLYRHVTNRADLLRQVARLILADVKLPACEPTDDWQEQVVELCIQTRKAILQHPNAAPLLLQFLPHQILLPGYEVRAKLMIENDVASEELLPIIRGLESLTFGAALFEAAAISDRQPPFPGPSGPRYPHLTHALEANRQDPDRLFRTTIQNFLRGSRKADDASEARRATKR